MTESPWEVVVGLEVHAQLETRTKLFCACPNRAGAQPNTLVCPICLGYPGTLPVTNARAVELGVRFALALGCAIREESIFARKNYFYPDLPKGYQITQYDRPFAEGGSVTIENDGAPRAIPLRRIHLEEDAGKTLHENLFPDVPDDVSLLDFNRAGVPLIEIVTEPALASADEAHAFLAKLRQLLLYTGTSAANMEEGNLRADANVSIKRKGALELGTRVEIKNLNSLKFLRQAIASEVERQTAILESGGSLRQETRLWDADRAASFSMRSKEEEEDYRYFPDPDLPPLHLDDSWLVRLRDELPELPDSRRARFRDELGLAPFEAALLSDERERADRFETEIVPRLRESDEVRAGKARIEDAIRVAARLEAGPVLELEKDRHPGEPPRVAPEPVAELAALVAADVITFGVAKSLLAEAAANGSSPRALVAERSLAKVSDHETLRVAVTRVMAQNPGPVAEYRAGNAKVLGFLVGRVMAETRGTADARIVGEILKAELERD